MKVRSKPLPPPKRLKERYSGEEEEVEMTGLTATTEEDKDDYYFEDPSNIGTATASNTASITLSLCEL